MAVVECKGGPSWSDTMKFGFAATENPVHVHELTRHLLHLMGPITKNLTLPIRPDVTSGLTDVHGNVGKKPPLSVQRMNRDALAELVQEFSDPPGKPKVLTTSATAQTRILLFSLFVKRHRTNDSEIRTIGKTGDAVDDRLGGR